MQDQMEGWVDQFVVIADASNQVADNTNFGFTKRILTEAYRVTIGRPYKIVAFDISFLGTAFFRVLKPLLPNNLIECVKIFGDDRAELLEELRNYMQD
jgi:dsDNA-specific endonuclease/ATPase MutS2